MASSSLKIIFVLLCIIATTHGKICGRVDDNHRFDCHPEFGASQEKCEARGCCWAQAERNAVDPVVPKLNVPYCYYPLDYPGYVAGVQTSTNYGFTTNLTRSSKSYYPRDVTTLKMDVYFESESRLRVKIFDPDQARYEVPIHTPPFTSKATDPMYDVNLVAPNGFTVTRKASKETIFNTTVNPGFIYSDQFIQLSSSLSSSYIYGLGEHRSSLALPTNWQSFTFWARDQHPTPDTNLYGVHPFYINLEPNGDAHGVFLLNSNAMDAILQPAPAITYRTIGGILDFYIFLGPEPIDVVRQYQDVVGKPFKPPMWSLGFHLCRYGYDSAKATRDVVERMRNASIPQDVQWNDIDYMDRTKDFTVDMTNYGDLAPFVKDFHSEGLHYMMIFDPAISSSQSPGSYPPYDTGVMDNIFTKTDDGSVFVGKVWPGDAAFPDWSHPNATRWWQTLAQKFHSTVGFDGMWLDMNEPSNFVDGRVKGGCPANDTYNNPPYVPGVLGNKLYSRTVCPSARQSAGLHYNVHSLYGLLEANVSYTALANILQKRPFIISRSTFPSSGRYTGHWTGDNESEWPEMHSSITSILNFNMFGIPMVGADICGFGGNTTEELCTRWMQLGAFYPFSRNHNSLHSNAQDPTAFSKASQASSMEALLLRYSLLPYLYTLFQHAHANGSMVARPLFFNFPRDPSLYKIDTQFMLGGALLISPVLTQGATTVTATFPPGRWYNNDANMLEEPPLTFTKTTNVTLDAPLNKINLHFRGGYIIPSMIPHQTTTMMKQNPVIILIICLDKDDGSAKGHMYWDDGDDIGSFEDGRYTSWSFQAKNNEMTSRIDHDGFQGGSEMKFFGAVVEGVSSKPSSVTLNGQACEFTYSSTPQILDANCPNLPFNKPLTLKWG